MKVAALAATLAYIVLPAPPAAAADTLAWQLIGTNPDVYAPSLHQPTRQDYFHRADVPAPTFLHPQIGMSFAALRNAEQHQFHSPR